MDKSSIPGPQKSPCPRRDSGYPPAQSMGKSMPSETTERIYLHLMPVDLLGITDCLCDKFNK